MKTTAIQERRRCSHPGCAKAIRRPLGASSLCAAGHVVPASQTTLPPGAVLTFDATLSEEAAARLKADFASRNQP